MGEAVRGGDEGWHREGWGAGDVRCGRVRPTGWVLVSGRVQGSGGALERGLQSRSNSGGAPCQCCMGRDCGHTWGRQAG